jgi:hypothetical protein
MTGGKSTVAKLINCALLVAVMLAPANAQGIRGDYNIDCKLFQKKTDGTWFLIKQTTVHAGVTRIALAPGTYGPRDVMIGSADLHSILLDACGAVRIIDR